MCKMYYMVVKMLRVKNICLLENGRAKHQSVPRLWDFENSILKDINYEENAIM